MNTFDSVETLRAETSRAATAAWGAFRRMAITLTTKALWQLTGFNLGDGNVETFTAELFTGMGFYARPPSSGKPEAVVASVGSAKAPVIVGVRDEATRSKIAGGIAEDETMAFNSQCVLYLKSDGTIEARAANGAAVPLALKADVDALAAYVDGTLKLAVAGTANLITGAVTGTATVATTTAPVAQGTSVLKGQ